MAKEYHILQETLKQVLSNSSLDVGAKYFVLKDVMRDVESEYVAQIKIDIANDLKGGADNAESVQHAELGE